MYKQIVSIMFTTMISFNYCSQGYTSRLSKLCFPLWFQVTIVHKDVQADCLNYVYHSDFITYCSQGCTSRLSQLCLSPWFHLTIVYKDVQAGGINYVYQYDFI